MPAKKQEPNMSDSLRVFVFIATGFPRRRESMMFIMTFLKRIAQFRMKLQGLAGL
jgi:hypothetical protein